MLAAERGVVGQTVTEHHGSHSLKMTAPLRARLTREDLCKLVREMLGVFGANKEMLRFGLGASVVIELLGAKHGATDVGRPVLTTPLFAPNSDVIGQSRQERFGEALFNLQSTQGFSAWVDDYDVSALEPRFAEMDAAYLMARAGVLCRLRGRTGKKRQDYDCDLAVRGVELPCDIKAKLETTAVSIPTFLEAIERAQRQLPKDRPGVVWIRLPRAWMEPPEPTLLTIAVAMADVHLWAEPVVAVIVHWEEAVGTLAVALKWKLYACGSTDHDAATAADLEGAIRAAYGSTPWTRFSDVIDECLSDPSKAEGRDA
ncbi:MAG TPA: hypothetical protein VHO67_10425 [Polyangia bacterium]|nr:hypothetical protein [Polyangia bacterium]